MCSFEGQQIRTTINQVTDVVEHIGHRAGARGLDGMLHLHRFHNCQGGTGFHLLTGFGK